MLSKLLTPFTTATAGGVVFRDLFIAVGAIISLLGIVGALTPQQAAELRQTVDEISGQWPQIVAAFGVIMAAGMSAYRAIAKSMSNRAAEVAKVTDESVPVDMPVRIQTPANVPDIIVPAKV